MALKISEIRERLALGRVRKTQNQDPQVYIAASQRMAEVETEKAVMLIMSDARGMNLIRP